jgi:hypothetical protein
MGMDADERQQDAILWAHILLMILSFGIIFPAGMVLGVSRTSGEDQHRSNRCDRLFGIDGTSRHKYLEQW